MKCAGTFAGPVKMLTNSMLTETLKRRLELLYCIHFWNQNDFVLSLFAITFD